MRSLIVLSLFGAVTWAVATYDYVIVGGGTTGLVVANRLTEDTSSMHITLTFLQYGD
jgi:ribulose 1,5-bisphosphate synthetase/thiazole synthase